MSEHYFSENPESEIKEKGFTESICGQTLSFTSVSGVFSFETKIDKASRNMIENFRPSGSSILVIGCGYGAIGLFLKRLFPEQNVTMIDINSRALDYTRLNASANKLKVNAVKSNLFDQLENVIYDDIVTNPPIAAGKELNTRLITQAFEHISPNGALWLVAFHNKGGETLKNIMKQVFGNVTDVDKRGGIRVYKSTKPASL